MKIKKYLADQDFYERPPPSKRINYKQSLEQPKWENKTKIIPDTGKNITNSKSPMNNKLSLQLETENLEENYQKPPIKDIKRVKSLMKKK